MMPVRGTLCNRKEDMILGSSSRRGVAKEVREMEYSTKRE